MNTIKKKFLESLPYSSKETWATLLFERQELKQMWIEALQKEKSAILHLHTFERHSGVPISIDIPNAVIISAILTHIESQHFSVSHIENYEDIEIIKQHPDRILENVDIQRLFLKHLTEERYNKLTLITSPIVSLESVSPEVVKQIQTDLSTTIPLSDYTISAIKKGIEKGVFSPEFLKEIETIHMIGTRVGLSGIEYHAIQSLSPEEKTILLGDPKHRDYAALIVRIHTDAVQTYQTSDQQGIIAEGFEAWKTTGFDPEELWKYLTPNGNRHDELQHIPTFISHIPDTPEDKKIALLLFRASTLGSGLQRQTLRHIMEYVTPEIWETLKTKSAYPNQAPPLSDLGKLNLIRIKNEIQLYQNKELSKSLDQLPQDSPLRQYALTLLEHPTINIDAITAFVSNPDAFFDSRTGAGEEGAVAAALSILSPTGSHSNWNAREARDAIIDGTYDRVNVFPAGETTWQEPGKEFIHVDNLITELSRLPALNFSYTREALPKKHDKTIAPHLNRTRIELFLSDIRVGCQDLATCDAILSHIQEKGSLVIQKAVNLASKRSKFSDVEKQSMQSLAESLRVQAIEQKNPALFWDHISTLGFLDTMQLHQHITRISGGRLNLQLPNEESYLNYLSRHTPEGKDILLRSLTKIRTALEATGDMISYSVAILRPSDPEVATAGSTTGNCDAFGHGKKAHYMINPGTAQLLLRRNGRVIAQSTLTMGAQLFPDGENRTTFLNQFKQSVGKIGDTIEATTENERVASLQRMLETLATAAPVITLDSIEVIPNLPTDITKQRMQSLLQTGFGQLGKEVPLYQTAEVRAGTQYSFFKKDDGDAENTAIPIVPLPYTDDIHAKNKLIRTGTSDKARRAANEPALRKATPTDALAIALMEEIAFRRSGGASYVTGYPAITSELWESTMATEHRNQSPLSFITHDTKGVPTGYLIAYTQRESIYITDTATTGVEKGTGARLLLALLESVAKDASHQKKPITMDCRGATSAQAIATKKEFLESLTFDSSAGTVHYMIKGPSLEQINGDGLYHFTFVPHSEGGSLANEVDEIKNNYGW